MPVNQLSGPTYRVLYTCLHPATAPFHLLSSHLALALLTQRLRLTIDSLLIAEICSWPDFIHLLTIYLHHDGESV